jgi:hypothetical protein
MTNTGTRSWASGMFWAAPGMLASVTLEVSTTPSTALPSAMPAAAAEVVPRLVPTSHTGLPVSRFSWSTIRRKSSTSSLADDGDVEFRRGEALAVPHEEVVRGGDAVFHADRALASGQQDDRRRRVGTLHPPVTHAHAGARVDIHEAIGGCCR